MLHDFLTQNRAELIELCKAKVGLRRVFVARDAQLESGIPAFLDQVISTLRIEQTVNPMSSRQVSGPSGGGPVPSEVAFTASLHGRELLTHGYTVEQVVHDYGDLCQAITEMAFAHSVPFTIDEFRTLNRCLDNGIAAAVKEFGYQRDLLFTDEGVRAVNERLGFLAHEMRNFIHTATLAVAAMKSGYVGMSGSTAGVLDRSLAGMRALIDGALADVRVTAGLPARHEMISLAGFVAEAGQAASLEAQTWDAKLVISEVDETLAIEVDRDLMAAAVANLLQNAFKFTHVKSTVSLKAYASADRILIDVEDCCGGLPPGSTEKMFEAFTQTGANKSGLGLGLTISRRSVQANNGVLTVRNLADKGCVFTIDLPRHVMPGRAAPEAEALAPAA